jgi:glycosyltransferase involved in cell wall biosynthesis
MNAVYKLISVVVPTYNRAHLITDALESIRLQDYRPIEIIVVDDGSTDSTSLVITQWFNSCTGQPDLSLQYIEQANQGGNVARNAGITAANGDFVAFLDSDDQWHASKLTKQCQLFSYDDRVGAVYCGVQHIALETGLVTESSVRVYPRGFLLDEMLVHDVTAPTSTYVVRKMVFEKVGVFDESLQARQDWDMWIRVAAEFQIDAVPEPLVDYREHSGPRTASNPQREVGAYKTIMAKYSSLRSRRSLAVRQAAKSAFFRRMGRVHFHQKIGVFKALVFYMRAIVAWPFAFDNYAAFAGWFLPASQRSAIHRAWNRVFGDTILAIRSH